VFVDLAVDFLQKSIDFFGSAVRTPPRLISSYDQPAKLADRTTSISLIL
jgi:hypothetical protein